MRELVIQRLHELLFFYGKPSPGSTRWAPVFVFIANVHSIDANTKQGRKFIKSLDLFDELDMTITVAEVIDNLNDAKLLKFFELVHRRFYVCM
jgi:hypothetical protein